MPEGIDLIDFLREVPQINYVLINSFKYNPHFFENEIFPIFKGKTLPILLIDYYEYQKLALEFGESHLIGRKYILESIQPQIKSIFHSKLLLAVSKTKILLLIGSNNLTYEGYKKNAELLVPIVIDLIKKENLELIEDIIDYLINLKILISKQYQADIDKVTNHLKRINTKYDHEDRLKRRSSWILHNIKKPLMTSIREIINDNIQELTVISPYFSRMRGFYEKILDLCHNVNIIIQQKTNNLSTEILKKLDHISYFEIILNEDNERFLHSKLLLFKTNKGMYSFCGSANFTHPALISNENVELGILSKLDITLNDILNGFGEIKSINLDDIKSQPFQIDDQVIGDINFILKDAIRRDNQIIIKIPEDLIFEADIFIYFGNERKKYNVETQGDELIFTVPDEDIELLKKSLPIKIVIDDQGKIMSSDYRILYNPQFFHEKFDFLNFFNFNDANYIFYILNKLSKLQIFDDGDTILDEGVTILDILAEEGLFTQSEKEIAALLINKKLVKSRIRITLKDFINRFQKRHQRRIEKAVRSQNSETYDEFLTSFLLTNKSIIWAVNYGKTIQINELRKIRINLDFFIFEYINLFEDNRLIHLLKQSNLKYHFVLLTFIIDFLQVKSGKFKPERFGINPVKQSFERSTIASLIIICNKDNFILNREILQDLIIEYGLIIDGINKINLENIIKRLNSLIFNVSQKPNPNLLLLRD